MQDMQEWIEYLMRRWNRLHPEEKAMSVRRLAARAGVAPGTIQRLKRGQGLQRDSMRAIADALDVPVHALSEPGSQID